MNTTEPDRDSLSLMLAAVGHLHAIRAVVRAGRYYSDTDIASIRDEIAGRGLR